MQSKKVQNMRNKILAISVPFCMIRDCTDSGKQLVKQHWVSHVTSQFVW